MKKGDKYSLYIVIVVILMFFTLSITRSSESIDQRIFDTFLRVRPDPVQNKQIVLVDIDDSSLSEIGTWPISRSITADNVMLLAELGARSSTFDIEYVNKSPVGVDSKLLQDTIPQRLDDTFGTLSSQTGDLFTALFDGRFGRSDGSLMLGLLQNQLKDAKNNIDTDISLVQRDHDLYLAQAARFSANTYFTINIQDELDSNLSPEARNKAVALHSISARIKNPEFLSSKAEAIPVISPIIEEAKGIGFTNVPVDNDGVRRRVDLLARFGDAVFPQLVLSPLLDYLGKPKVRIELGAYVIEDATMPDGSKRTLTIPRSPDGSVLIDWPHGEYVKDSFRHVSFKQLLVHEQAYDQLLARLKSRLSYGYLDILGGQELLSMAEQATELKKAIMAGEESPDLVPMYRGMRDQFLSSVADYLAAEPDKALLQEVQRVLDNPKSSPASKTDMQTIAQDIPVFFAELRTNLERLQQNRTQLAELLAGAFCIIGQTNTGSTDLGTTPFQKKYPNVGTHASLVNMILNDRFINEISPLWSLLFAGIALFIFRQFSRALKPSRAIIGGALVAVGLLGIALLIFALSGLYIPAFTLVAPFIAGFIADIFLTFLLSEREKSFLRNAFSRYLSEEVIKQIVADPKLLQLGGTQRNMTAMFTDIKGFSTVSEKLSPQDLVGLLNQYLTAMSDIVLDEGGTIDKYEGDAIIAFFGAPLDLPDHARRSLRSAVRMKKIEEELNARFLAEGIAPSPLKTRIGLNTGEMVVGNMGTARKMDYTIIGDAVNLAARLEGVNKQYGTWICVAEDTINVAGDGFIVRKLDRVRVVGKNVPIRIFEVLGFSEDASPELLEGLKLFDQAMAIFEERKWKTAKTAFEKVLKMIPEDGPSLRYVKKCIEFDKTPPPAQWDGVYNLEFK